MTTYYSIDSVNGNQITTGISEHLARRTAQQLADTRNETVTLYSDDDSEEIEPTSISVELDGPSGPRVTYGAQDAETVETEIPAGWEVDWSSAVNLAPTGTHCIRYSAPLVSDGTVEATIAERDGWPDAGDYVLAGDDVYQIVTIASRIHTGETGTGAPNYVFARIRLADWDDLPDGQEPAWSAGIVEAQP